VSRPVGRRSVASLSLQPKETCPHWCVVQHGLHTGEDDWLHLGEPVALGDGVLARLCLSVDPRTGAQDGPYVVVGSSEYTVEQAEALGTALVTMARAGRDATRP
jgi:hypothetical protein